MTPVTAPAEAKLAEIKDLCTSRISAYMATNSGGMSARFPDDVQISATAILAIADGTADSRWTSLRDQIARDIAIEQQLGDDYSESSGDLSWDSANQHWGRAAALREVLATMERMELSRSGEAKTA